MGSGYSLLFPSPPARWNILAEREPKRFPSSGFGRQKQAISASLQWYLPDKHNPHFYRRTWAENDRGGQEAVSICFSLACGHGWNVLAEREPRRDLSSRFGGQKKLFPRIPSGTSRTNTTHVFTGGHGQKNDSGGHEAVSICFFSRLRNDGTFLPNENHNETLGRVLGDKTKLILRLSRGAPRTSTTHVFSGGYGLKNRRGGREAGCSVFFILQQDG